MKIYRCDCCGAQVNDYGHKYGSSCTAMYELNMIYEDASSLESRFGEFLICQTCVEKLLNSSGENT